MNRIPHQDPRRGEEGLTGRPERLRRLARAYTCVRACTRDDRYDNSRKRTHTLSHCQETDSDRRIFERMRAGWPTVPPFDGGPFLAVLSAVRAFDRGSPATRSRERSGLLLRGSASLKSSIYLSIFITARSLLLLHLFHPLSLSLCRTTLSFFFPLFSLLISPGSLSGLSLSLSAIGIALARRLSVDAQLASSLGDARGPYTRGASTSIFLRFIAVRLRNASNAVHAA